MNLLDREAAVYPAFSVFSYCFKTSSKTYFLQLTWSPSSTVTIWWEGLIFVGWYTRYNIKLNFSWQCSCLDTLPASPTSQDDVYTRSLVYGSIHLLILNTFILPAPPSAVISAGPVAVHLSGHDWTDVHKILRRKVMQATAINTEHVDFISLSPFSFSPSFPFSSVISFICF